MEDLIKRISRKVGTKWTLLFEELELNSELRYAIEAKFVMMPDHPKCQELLNLWLNQISIKNLEDEEKVKRLIRILYKIEPLRNIAMQIGFEQYTEMPVENFESGKMEAVSAGYPHPPNLPLPPIVCSHDSSGFGLGMLTTTSTLTADYASVSLSEHIPTTPACRESVYLPTDPISFGDHGSHGLAHFMTFSTSDNVVPHVCQYCGAITSEEVSVMKAVPGLSNPLIGIETHPCDAVIIIQDRYHKYALLDISQRMLHSNWKKIGHELKLSHGLITHLEECEKNIQERYYKLLVEFVTEFKEKATFRILREVLRECDENLAADILEERLQTRTELVISAIQYDFITNKNL